ncbi:MAG: aminotransferase class I/II-fold pyridoxal phosphate-dependent enzyme [Eggerthellaceae bacterium]|nr:aminotransferase class I/II-fold pyridoxal phosphate-dependent enzyme [Eggerthellaceae bacterium]
MTSYAQTSSDELHALRAALEDEYNGFKAKGLSLNMARGKPSAAQLDLSLPLLDILSSTSDLRAADGTDIRNYGVGTGLPEARTLMAVLLDDDPANVIVCGNSSLNIMYDEIARCMNFGTLGCAPWATLDTVKWLCPVPGYDRHFAITEQFGIEMINIAMDDNGPCMDQVEELVANDPAIKGIWCVPTYSNPGGVEYSDEVVRRLARMTCAAPDFRIFWDNAYCVHHLDPDPAHHAHVLDIGAACREAGHPDRYLKFASTSKITFPGAGVAALAASPANIAEIARMMNVQTIGHDKFNQLRHVRFLKDADGIAAHMAKHAAIIRPKFDLVEQKLSEGLADVDCHWSTPRGGYFVCFYGPAGTAKRIVELAKEAGVTMTGAGAPFPYHKDPDDSVIRIAPTLPPIEELDLALDVFVCCVKLASVEVLLND